MRKKKKKVHFGGLLSPELFDKNLPPSTPLQKGGTPFRAPTPARGLTLQSVLKKSGRSETPRTCGRPDLSSLIELSASPSLMLPHRSRVTFEDEGERTDVEEEEEVKVRDGGERDNIGGKLFSQYFLYFVGMSDIHLYIYIYIFRHCPNT